VKKNEKMSGLLGGGDFFDSHCMYSAFETTLNSCIVSYRILYALLSRANLSFS